VAAHPTTRSTGVPGGRSIETRPLDRLERQIDVSNQNLRQFDAALRAARAEVREQQSEFLSSLTVTPQIQRQKNALSATASYTLQGTATWEPDVWGKIRRNVESSVANAQASAAELAAARLSAQAQLATDYFGLHYSDSLNDLLDRNRERLSTISPRSPRTSTRWEWSRGPT